MVTPEAELIPHYGLYRFMARISDPVLATLGGYTAHNIEALRAVKGQPVIVSPNHRAGIDSFVLGLSVHNLPDLTANSPKGPLPSRPIHFMAKDTLWKYPVIKQVVEGCGAFPVERYKGTGLKNEQIEHIAKLVNNNAVLCIYPEGTRYPEDVDFVDRAKLKSTVAFLALTHGVPLVPVGIAGSRNLSKLPREVVFGDAIWVPKHEDIGSAEFKIDKDELMDELHAQINSNYQIARHYFNEQQA